MSEGDCVMGGYFFEGSKIISGENKKKCIFHNYSIINNSFNVYQRFNML